MIFINKISKKPISTKRLKINATPTKSNNKGQQKYWNRLKRNNKSMVYKPHMLTQNIIKFWKN